VITLKKHILATRVNSYVNKSTRAVARGLGISVSEYLRNLILQDLNSKKMFVDEPKRTVEQPEEDQRTPKDKLLESLSWQPEEERSCRRKDKIRSPLDRL